MSAADPLEALRLVADDKVYGPVATAAITAWEKERAENRMNLQRVRAIEASDSLEKIVEALFDAWGKYEAFFGEPPHGTHKQLAALVELAPALIPSKAERDWAPIPNATGYEVSKSGAVRSYRLLHQAMHTQGYLSVYIGPTRKNQLVHRLVLESFVGPPEPGQEARHKNGNKDDNRLSNLEWGTRVENSADKFRHGTQPLGERQQNAKLSAAQVTAAREMRRAGVTYKEIARRFGVHRQTITSAINGDTWGHVK